MKELLGAADLEHPHQLGPEHVIRRVSRTEARSLAALHHWVKPNELLHGESDHAVFKVFWKNSSPETFAQPPNTLSASSRRGECVPAGARAATL